MPIFVSLVLMVIALVLAVLSFVPVAARFPLLNIAVVIGFIVWFLDSGLVHLGTVH
jgi:hypothetical protein